MYPTLRNKISSALFLEAFFRKSGSSWTQAKKLCASMDLFSESKEEMLEKISGVWAYSNYAGISALSWPQNEASRYESLGLKITAPGQPDWPISLDDLADVPLWLWYRGAAPSLLQALSPVSIVGSRRPTPYTAKACSILAKQLARRGNAVVSGLALGVDGIAHRSCLEAGGVSAAFLPCGLMHCYPPEHRELMMQIESHGTVISELPPESMIRKMNFSSRNRLIAAMSGDVLILQARQRSGTMITAHHAIDQGKRLFVLPSPWNLHEFSGSLELLSHGVCALSGPEMVDELEQPCMSEKRSKILAEILTGRKSELTELNCQISFAEASSGLEFENSEDDRKDSEWKKNRSNPPRSERCLTVPTERVLQPSAVKKQPNKALLAREESPSLQEPGENSRQGENLFSPDQLDQLTAEEKKAALPLPWQDEEEEHYLLRCISWILNFEACSADQLARFLELPLCKLLPLLLELESQGKIIRRDNVFYSEKIRTEDEIEDF